MSDPQRRRILFVAREFTAGGAAYLAIRQMRRLISRYDIDFVCTGPMEEKMRAMLPSEVTYFHLGAGFTMPGVSDELNCLELFLRHRELPIFRNEYHAVLGTSLFPDWHACFVFSLARAPRKLLFLVDEGMLYKELPAAHLEAIECGIRSATFGLPVSRRLWERMAAQSPALSRHAWQVQRTPVDVDLAFLDSPASAPDWGVRDRPVVVTVSRLAADKQVMECLLVHHRLKQEGLVLRWYLAGSGPEEAALRAEITRLGMEGDFILAGNLPSVHAWMKHADIFTLLSSSEGCPTVVLEALLTGTPVVMTDVNGADELIDDGRTGIIVKNNLDSMAAGMARLVSDASLREEFRRNIAANPPVSDAARETAFLIGKIEEPAPAPAAPQVTILIPAYNHEASIDRAIASALMQEFPTLEVIVCDDASTDATETHARDWLHNSRLRYVRNEHNLGRVANYHKALTEHARGEWVLMLDGDDYLIDPGFIRLAYESLQRAGDRRPVFAQAGHRVHYTDGKTKDVDILPSIGGAQKLMQGGEYVRFVYETGFFTHLGVLFRRDAAIANGFYTLDISSSDMDSLLRLALEGEVLVLNTIAGFWVQHGANASSNLALDNIAANVRIFRDIARAAARRGILPMSEIDGIITRYEAHTLVHLFKTSIGTQAKGPRASLKMLRIILSVNPRLLFNKKLMSAWYECLRVLLAMRISKLKKQ